MVAGQCGAKEEDCPPPPQPLVLAWRCYGLSKLPDAGGIRDQVAGDMERMRAAYNVYCAVSSWHTMFYGGGDMDRWLKYHEHDWKIVQEWMELREWRG